MEFFIKLSVFLTLCCCCWDVTTSYKILAFIPVSSKSHKAPFVELTAELARRGHEVTMVTCHEPSKIVPGVQNIVVKEADFTSTDLARQSFNMSVSSSLKIFLQMTSLMKDLCYLPFNNSEFMKLLKMDGHYDVVIAATVLSECYMGYLNIFKAPVILLSPSALMSHIAWAMDIPSPPSYIPNIMLSYDQRMSFVERLINFMSTAMMVPFFLYYIPFRVDPIVQERLQHEGLPKPIGNVDAIRNASLILVNTHFSLDGSRPLMPYFIEIGGMHCRPAKRVPKEFETFIDGAKDDGFIVFSLGSVVQSQYIPPNLIEVFKKAFARIKPRVIWKFENDLENLPPNVMISPWIPQQDLIGHPKCRLAITHGGLLSLQEAVYHGVPLLGVPLGADRDGNFARAVQKGFALIVDWQTVTDDILVEKLNTLLEDSRYKGKAIEMAAIMKDRPQTALETAVYWVEYVIRHKGAPHLKSGASHLNIFQYFLLDVFGAVIVLLAVVVVLLIVFVKLTVRFLRFFICRPAGVKSKRSKTD